MTVTDSIVPAPSGTSTQHGTGPVAGGVASPRVAALDGLRGFALIGMLLWHAEVTWVQGGFARMTIFFALSGYLATMSWLRGRGRSGGFRQFWWRRARRLLPVSFLGVAAAVAVTATTGTPGMRDRLGGDVLSVLGYVSNLRFWLSEQSYGELFNEPSLLQHYWTLSIEEQAFIVLPVLLAAVMALTGGGRTAAAVIAVIGVACMALPAVVDHSPDAVWYSSIVRFGEFCGGVVLALWCARAGQARAPHATRAVSVAGIVGLGTLVAVMLTIPRDAEWLYRGGMGLVVIPTVACLAAAAANVGPASRILGWAPLARLGRWTFSIYVLHWPLFWILDRTRTGLDGWELATVRMAAAVALGAVAHVLIERPLMASGPAAEPARAGAPALERLDRVLLDRVPRGWWRTRPAFGALTAAGLALVVTSQALPGAAVDDDQVRFDFFDDIPAAAVDHNPASTYQAPDAPRDGIAPTTSAGTTTDTDDDASTGRAGDVAAADVAWVGTGIDDETFGIAQMRMIVQEPGRIRLGIFGGSVATVLDGGGIEYRTAHPDLAVTPGATKLGCGLVSEGERVVGWDEVTGRADVGRVAPVCAQWPDTWRAVSEMAALDVALVVPGTWDTMDFDLDGIGPARIGDAAFDAVLETHLVTMVEGFRAAGVDQVQLATTPPNGPGAGGAGRQGLPADHAERVALLNEALARFADGHADVVVVDVAGHVDSWDDDARWRPDGLHYSPAGAHLLWEQFLGDAVVGAYDARSNDGDTVDGVGHASQSGTRPLPGHVR